MSRKAKRHSSGGRTGQHHRKTPSGLRSFEVPPAGPTTITRADGTTEVQPPARSRTGVARSARPSVKSPSQRKEPVPIEEIRPLDVGRIPDSDERRRRDRERLAAEGKRVIPATSAVARSRQLRVDNGTSTPGTPGPTMGAFVRSQKAASKGRSGRAS